MNDDLEKQLRSALRPVDPDEGFEDRVMARVRRTQTSPRRWQTTGFRRGALAIAASAVLAVVAFQSWQTKQQQRGLEARQQLIEALRVTGEKLDLAYQGVNNESRRSAPDDAGA